MNLTCYWPEGGVDKQTEPLCHHGVTSSLFSSACEELHVEGITCGRIKLLKDTLDSRV